MTLRENGDHIQFDNVALEREYEGRSISHHSATGYRIVPACNRLIPELINNGRPARDVLLAPR